MLTTHKREAASGEADALVIFLHGYGADGKDLLGLADPLEPYLPNVSYIAPDAPERCANNPMGYQWFPIPWLDGSSEEAMEASIGTSTQILNDWLDETAKETDIPAERTVLVGFSQGTMMSLHVGPTRNPGPAGIVGFSGRLMMPELLKDAKSKMPIMLVHGDMDDMVPPSSLPEAAGALQEAGFTVYTHISPGTGHSIAPDGLGMGLSLIRLALGIGQESE